MMSSEPRRLSPVVRQVLGEAANELYVSSISIWEISVKCSSGKLKLALALPDVVRQWIADYGLKFIEFSLRDALLEQKLAGIHRDPFDRMLVCQALSRQLVIATPDEAIRQYDVPAIW